MLRYLLNFFVFFDVENFIIIKYRWYASFIVICFDILGYFWVFWFYIFRKKKVLVNGVVFEYESFL